MPERLPSIRRSTSATWFVAVLLLVSGCISVPSNLTPAAAPKDFKASSAKPPRTLVIALDAVPYDAAVAAFEASPPSFDRYQQPVPVISSFPSTTTLAFTGMFEGVGLTIPPGYEAKFYDLQEGRIRGGGPVSYGKIEFSWREFFDWKTEGTFSKAVGYSRPVAFSRAEFRRGVQAFLDSPSRVFYMYVGATDGVAHLAGPDAFVSVLADLIAVLEEARRHEPDFGTIIFSDHGVGGGEPLKNVRELVVRAARDAGFRTRGRIQSAEDLVLVPFGLLSSFVAFTARGQESVVARRLAGVDGVQLCAAREASETGRNSFLVSSGTSHATLEVDLEGASGNRWRYLRHQGDPLLIGPVFDAHAGGDGWLDDRRLLLETSGHRFPDPAHRIARAFDLVRHEASVVCSVAPGYMFGGALTEFAGRVGVGRLRWTHGSLERDDTLGFVTVDRGAPAILDQDETALRFDQLAERLGLTRPNLRPRRLKDEP